MKILLTSDLHGSEDAFRSFSRALQGDYDIGVIAGDLFDDKLTEAEASRLPHEPGESVDRRSRRGLLTKEARIVEVLKAASKPVVVVPGNHDTTPLTTNGTFINIHLKKHLLNGVSFVGYRCISPVLGPDLQMALLADVEGAVSEKAILVTHIAPLGTLDLKSTNGRMEFFGNGILAEFVAKRRPRFHFFGDAHESVGVKGSSINASYPLVSSFCGIDSESGDIWTERGA